MMRIAGRAFAALIVLGAIAPAIAADRTADEIIADIDAIKPFRSMPDVLKDGPKKVELISELYKVAPDHEKIPALMAEKWTTQLRMQKTDDVLKDCDEVIASTKNDKVKVEAGWSKAIATFRKSMPAHPEAFLAAVDQFLAIAPKDPRGAQLLMASVADAKDKDKQIAAEDRVLKDYPDSPTALSIKGQRRLREAVGKPFDLEFTEAITDKTISMKDLKGKVVVVDFWATWCGPCIAEMPNMKKLYAEYKDKGVEFIGVSLDQPKEQGGLDKLKEFVAKNEIAWPQYYQGKGWESEFSAGWGINSIPCVFVVDPKGNLFSTEARGQLEKMIPELLKKAKGDANSGGGQ